MKRTVSFIFIFTVIMFTACADKASTPKPSYDETILTEITEGDMENTTEDTTEIEISDEEYLINLGNQLKRGMTEKEVIDKIGEPYDRLEGSGMLYVLMYKRGECGLSVFIQLPDDKVSNVRVHNDETGENIYPLYNGETETTE